MAARTVYAIRTHRDSAAVRRLHNELTEAVGPASVFVVVDELTGTTDWPTLYSRVAVTPALLAKLCLQNVRDAGWLCGDYSYYAMADAFQFDYMWLVEPDVRFANVDLKRFFGQFADCTLDFLARGMGPAGDWYWRPFLEARGMENIWRCHFALTRASRPAISAALRLRRHTAAVAVPQQLGYPNDESVFATAVVAAGLQWGDLQEFNPGSYRYFSFEMKFHARSVVRLCDGPQVIHGAVSEVEYVQHVRRQYAALDSCMDGSWVVKAYRKLRMIRIHKKALHPSDHRILRRALPWRSRVLLWCDPLLALVGFVEGQRQSWTRRMGHRADSRNTM